MFRLTLFTSLAVYLFTLPALAVSSVFLTLTDAAGKPVTVSNPATVTYISNAIEIFNWNFLVENTATLNSGTSGSGAGKVHMSDLSVTKAVDGNSAKFFQNMASGTHYSSVTLSFFKQGAAAKTSLYMTYTCGSVLVTSQSTSSGDPTPQEIVKFACTSFAQKYYSQDSSGTISTTPSSSGQWNFATNSNQVGKRVAVPLF